MSEDSPPYGHPRLDAPALPPAVSARDVLDAAYHLTRRAPGLVPARRTEARAA